VSNLPRTPEEYRQWWQKTYPDITYGCCACGCGERTKLRYRTQVKKQWFKGEPLKFIHRHGTNKKPRVDFGVNSNGGLCHCGCGNPAPIAKTTDRRFGLVEGEPVRYIKGHHNLLPESYTEEECGYETPCGVFRNEKVDGYGYVQREGRFIYAHRYFYEREYGSLPEGYQLHHKCGVKNCIRLSHLEPLSIVEHQRVHPRSKLSIEKAREIRHLVLACGESRATVAQHYGVSRDLVEAVIRGQTWNEGA
jgi:hypothetical protein